MTRLLVTLRRFRRDERGSMVVPFALWFPIFAAIMFSAIEIGAISIRHTVLEASLDDAVREIRIGTNAAYTHAEIKTRICDQATILPDCANILRLEMVRKDLRNWQKDVGKADCIDRSEPAKPVRGFANGMSNELMVLRACYRYKPVVSHLGLGSMLSTDGAGNATLISTSAFVQEP